VVTCIQWPFVWPELRVHFVRLNPVMAEKRKEESVGLWIAPRYSLKGPAGERAWANRPGGIPSTNRYLELADIALGLKKPQAKKRKAAVVAAHSIKKTEPYST
jgi:hypothetical protein